MTDDVETPVDETVDVDAMMQDAMSETAEEVVTDDTDAPDEAAPEAESDEPAEALAAPDPESVPAEEPLAPFAFNAFKQSYEVPGLKFDAKRNAIVAESPQALDRLKQMLSHGREWEARGRQELVAIRRENETLRSQPHPEIEHAKTFMGEFDALMKMEPEQAVNLFAQLYQNYPLMQAKAERAYAERVMEQATRAQQPPEPEPEVIVEQAQAGAAELVQQMLQDQPWANPDALADITQYLQDPRTLDQYVLRATRDMPEHGIRAGQYVADWDRARELAEKFMHPYRRAHEQTATVQKTAAQSTKIAQQNAASLATAKPKARPVAPAAKPLTAPAPKLPSDQRSELMRDVWAKWKDTQRSR